MTRDEAREEIQEMLKKDEPEVVASIFVRMYVDGKLDFEDLEFMVGECGFDLDEKFKNMPIEEQKKFVEGLLEESGEEKPEEKSEEEDFNEDELFEPLEEGKDERASKSEDYDGEKVYDKHGNPTQTEANGSPKDDSEEKDQAEKLYNLKF